MAMPRALAAYWRRKRGGKKRKLRKLRRGSAVNRRLKRRISMGRRRYGRRRRGHRGKKGIIFGMGVLDIGQMAMTLGLMGVPQAASDAMAGKFQEAGNDIAQNTTSNIVPIVVNNMLFGFTRRIISRFAPKAIKRIL